MKSMFVMSIAGPDSPGNIKAIAEITRMHGGEWVTSKVMRLDGQMTAMMKVVIDRESETRLKSELESQFTELHFLYAAAPAASATPVKRINLVVDCKDRPGLTKDINAVLASLDLVVENMECNRAHVSTIGEAVFTAKLALTVPESMSGEAVADEIEALAEDVRVSLVA